MSLYPRLEARVSAQERRYLHLDARLEELPEDMITNFKQISEQLGKQEDRFGKIETTMATKEDLSAMATQEDMVSSFKQISEYLGRQEDRLVKVETTMATREGMVASFEHISGHLGRQEDRLVKVETTMATREDLTRTEKSIREDMKAMATKEDLTTVEKSIREDMKAMENRILDAFKQLITSINPSRSDA